MSGYDMLVEVGGALFVFGVLWLVCGGVYYAWRWWLRKMEQKIIAERVDEWVKRRGLNEEEMASLRRVKARAEKERKLHGTD